MSEEVINQEELESSKNIYGLPFSEDIEIEGLVFESVSHSGPYKGAIDIAVKEGEIVLAPFEGEIVYVRDTNDQQGFTPEFAKFNNILEIKHTEGEFSHLSHIAKGSALVKVGDKVSKGQGIARVGFVGYSTRPHLHWMVFKKTPLKPGFKSLKINLTKPLQDLMK